MRHPETCDRWDVFEIVLDGPAEGNPFTDVELSAVFDDGERQWRVGGFYDGDGVYRIRFMPDAEGRWTFVTSSDAPTLDGLTGSFDCGPAATGNHGPVRTADTFHFAHADGTRYVPFGTTAYAWTHQVERLRTQTLRTLAASPSPARPRRAGTPPGSTPRSSGASRRGSSPSAASASRPTSSSCIPTTGGALRISAPRSTTDWSGTRCGGSPPSRTCGGRWPTSTT
jgi:hypothetical protein